MAVGAPVEGVVLVLVTQRGVTAGSHGRRRSRYKAGRVAPVGRYVAAGPVTLDQGRLLFHVDGGRRRRRRGRRDAGWGWHSARRCHGRGRFAAFDFGGGC